MQDRPIEGRGPSLAWLIIIAVAVRLAVIASWPPKALSFDVGSWSLVGDMLMQGVNPYRETDRLNWPPLWPAILFVLKQASRVLHTDFVLLLRLFLIGVEQAVIVVLYRFIRRWYPAAPVFKALLAGIALNPVCILLTCQHANFDVLVVLWLALGVSAVARYQERGDVRWWLGGAAAFGAGVLTKTVPLLMVALLVPGFQKASFRTRATGVLLFIGPALASVSALLAIAPLPTLRNVVLYRSTETGMLGVSGFLALAGRWEWLRVYEGGFLVLTLMVTASIALRLLRPDGGEPRRLLLAAALLMLWIPMLGAGFATQYLFWSVPLLAACAGLWTRRWDRVLLVAGAITALTYIADYALRMSYGYFLVLWHPSPAIVRWGFYVSTSRAASIGMRIPLFFAFLAVWGAGMGLLLKNPAPAKEP